jgi:aryl-alcohol dehydrogenase
VAVGVGLPQLEIDLTQHVRSGRTLRGCIEGDADPSELIPKLLEWIEQGRFPLGRLVQRFEFERINEAVEASASGAAVKPVLVF